MSASRVGVSLIVVAAFFIPLSLVHAAGKAADAECPTPNENQIYKTGASCGETIKEGDKKKVNLYGCQCSDSLVKGICTKDHYCEGKMCQYDGTWSACAVPSESQLKGGTGQTAQTPATTGLTNPDGSPATIGPGSSVLQSAIQSLSNPPAAQSGTTPPDQTASPWSDSNSAKNFNDFVQQQAQTPPPSTDTGLGATLQRWGASVFGNGNTQTLTPVDSSGQAIGEPVQVQSFNPNSGSTGFQSPGSETGNSNDFWSGVVKDTQGWANDVAQLATNSLADTKLALEGTIDQLGRAWQATVGNNSLIDFNKSMETQLAAAKADYAALTATQPTAAPTASTLTDYSNLSPQSTLELANEIYQNQVAPLQERFAADQALVNSEGAKLQQLQTAYDNTIATGNKTLDDFNKSIVSDLNSTRSLYQQGVENLLKPDQAELSQAADQYNALVNQYNSFPPSARALDSLEQAKISSQSSAADAYQNLQDLTKSYIKDHSEETAAQIDAQNKVIRDSETAVTNIEKLQSAITQSPYGSDLSKAYLSNPTTPEGIQMRNNAIQAALNRADAQTYAEAVAANPVTPQTMPQSPESIPASPEDYAAAQAAVEAQAQAAVARQDALIQQFSTGNLSPDAQRLLDTQMGKVDWTSPQSVGTYIANGVSNFLGSVAAQPQLSNNPIDIGVAGDPLPALAAFGKGMLDPAANTFGIPTAEQQLSALGRSSFDNALVRTWDGVQTLANVAMFTGNPFSATAGVGTELVTAERVGISAGASQLDTLQTARASTAEVLDTMVARNASQADIAATRAHLDNIDAAIAARVQTQAPFVPAAESLAPVVEVPTAAQLSAPATASVSTEAVSATESAASAFTPTAEQMTNLTRPLVSTEAALTKAETEAIQNFNQARDVYTGNQAKISAGNLPADAPSVAAGRDQYLAAARDLESAGLIERPAPLNAEGSGVDSIYRANTGEVLAERPSSEIPAFEQPYKIVGESTPAPALDLAPVEVPKGTGSSGAAPEPSTPSAPSPGGGAPSTAAPSSGGTVTAVAEKSPIAQFFDNILPFRAPAVTSSESPIATSISSVEAGAVQNLNDALAARSGLSTNAPVPVTTAAIDRVTRAIVGLADAGLSQRASDGAILNADGNIVALQLPISIPGQAQFALTNSSPGASAPVASVHEAAAPTNVSAVTPSVVSFARAAALAASLGAAAVPIPAFVPDGLSAFADTAQAREAASSGQTTVTASVYGYGKGSGDGVNQRLADGTYLGANPYTAASLTFPLGTRLKITNPANGRSVVVQVRDRGPYVGGRQLDVARGAAQVLGLGISVYRLKVEVVPSALALGPTTATNPVVAALDKAATGFLKTAAEFSGAIPSATQPSTAKPTTPQKAAPTTVVASNGPVPPQTTVNLRAPISDVLASLAPTPSPLPQPTLVVAFNPSSPNELPVTSPFPNLSSGGIAQSVTPTAVAQNIPASEPQLPTVVAENPAPSTNPTPAVNNTAPTSALTQPTSNPSIAPTAIPQTTPSAPQTSGSVNPFTGTEPVGQATPDQISEQLRLAKVAQGIYTYSNQGKLVSLLWSPSISGYVPMAEDLKKQFQDSDALTVEFTKAQLDAIEWGSMPASAHIILAEILKPGGYIAPSYENNTRQTGFQDLVNTSRRLQALANQRLVEKIDDLMEQARLEEPDVPNPLADIEAEIGRTNPVVATSDWTKPALENPVAPSQIATAPSVSTPAPAVADGKPVPFTDVAQNSSPIKSVPLTPEQAKGLNQTTVTVTTPDTQKTVTVKVPQNPAVIKAERAVENLRSKIGRLQSISSRAQSTGTNPGQDTLNNAKASVQRAFEYAESTTAGLKGTDTDVAAIHAASARLNQFSAQLDSTGLSFAQIDAKLADAIKQVNAWDYAFPDAPTPQTVTAGTPSQTFSYSIPLMPEVASVPYTELANLYTNTLSSFAYGWQPSPQIPASNLPAAIADASAVTSQPELPAVVAETPAPTTNPVVAVNNAPPSVSPTQPASVPVTTQPAQTQTAPVAPSQPAPAPVAQNELPRLEQKVTQAQKQVDATDKKLASAKASADTAKKNLSTLQGALSTLKGSNGASQAGMSAANASYQRSDYAGSLRNTLSGINSVAGVANAAKSIASATNNAGLAAKASALASQRASVASRVQQAVNVCKDASCGMLSLASFGDLQGSVPQLVKNTAALVSEAQSAASAGIPHLQSQAQTTAADLASAQAQSHEAKQQLGEAKKEVVAAQVAANTPPETSLPNQNWKPEIQPVVAQPAPVMLPTANAKLAEVIQESAAEPYVTPSAAETAVVPDTNATPEPQLPAVAENTPTQPNAVVADNSAPQTAPTQPTPALSSSPSPSSPSLPTASQGPVGTRPRDTQGESVPKSTGVENSVPPPAPASPVVQDNAGSPVRPTLGLVKNADGLFELEGVRANAANDNLALGNVGSNVANDNVPQVNVPTWYKDWTAFMQHAEDSVLTAIGKAPAASAPQVAINPVQVIPNTAPVVLDAVAQSAQVRAAVNPVELGTGYELLEAPNTLAMRVVDTPPADGVPVVLRNLNAPDNVRVTIGANDLSAIGGQDALLGYMEQNSTRGLVSAADKEALDLMQASGLPPQSVTFYPLPMQPRALGFFERLTNWFRGTSSATAQTPTPQAGGGGGAGGNGGGQPPATPPPIPSGAGSSDGGFTFGKMWTGAKWVGGIAGTGFLIGAIHDLVTLFAPASVPPSTQKPVTPASNVPAKTNTQTPPATITAPPATTQQPPATTQPPAKEGPVVQTAPPSVVNIAKPTGGTPAGGNSTGGAGVGNSSGGNTSGGSTSSGGSGIGGALGSILGNLMKMLGIGQPKSTTSTQPTSQSTKPSTTTTTNASSTPPTPTINLIANPSSIATGKKVILSWSGIGVTQCVLFAQDGTQLIAGGASGSVPSPVLTTTSDFRVTCAASAGAPISTGVTVTVK